MEKMKAENTNEKKTVIKTADEEKEALKMAATGPAAARRGTHRGRYNMDFEKEMGDPYGNTKKARDHIRSLNA